jgi:hypothetical protein
MTFPTENHPSRDDASKLNVLVKTSFSDPGSFFGLMSVSAAHRAALTGRHSDLMNVSGCDSRILYDPDYYVMKARCIREMNAKLQDPARALSDEACDTIVNLITGAVSSPFAFPADQRHAGCNENVYGPGISDSSVVDRGLL